MNVLEAIDWAKKELVSLEETEALASTEVLLSEVLGISRSYLLFSKDKNLSEEQENLFLEYVSKRKKRCPTAYIVNKAYFRNEELKVNEHCLIPRPETELLVDKVLELSGCDEKDSFLFLDLCAGSGAVGISLLRELQKAKAVFSDLSEDALKIVSENLRRYQLGGRSKVIESDLFNALNEYVFDAVISNPPYFANKDWASVEKEVLREPRMAFEAGEDGLEFYRRITTEVSAYLSDHGSLFLEVGRGQAKQVAELIQKSPLKLTGIFKDYQGIERIVVARKML